jgi:hypothetical protein
MRRAWRFVAIVLIGLAPPVVAGAQEVAQPSALQPLPRFALPSQPELEPKAVELLQAMSARLAGAKTLSFTAVATYESPARTGQPLAYTTLSQVMLQRPDKLRVITPGDGPPSEFYYDGKTMMAYTPGAELTAVASVPPTIDAMLKTAYDTAVIYFPFTDVIVADPYGDLAPDLKLAFVIGQSRVIGGTLTDMVAIANETAQAQIWIGAEDKLPRMIRVTFFNERGNYRHVVELSDWQLDPVIPPDAFFSAKAAAAKRIAFAPPGAP